MFCVFGAFVLGDDRQLKLFGLGLAIAVLIDATIVRMLLVPATMELLGDRNWWIPGWLDRILPHIDVEGTRRRAVRAAHRRPRGRARRGAHQALTAAMAPPAPPHPRFRCGGAGATLGRRIRGGVTMTGVVSDARQDAVRARAIGIGWVQKFGRLGWVAKGVVYVIVGVLAVPIAFSGGKADEGEASQQGAIAEIADTSAGTFLLLVVAVGLGLYALWRLVTALLPGDNDAETLAHRAGYLISAAIYGLLAWTALSWVVSDAGTSGSSGQQSGDERFLESVSRTLLESTAGRWLLGIGALVGIGVGVYFAIKAAKGSFMDELDLSGASSRSAPCSNGPVRRAGSAGR